MVPGMKAWLSPLAAGSLALLLPFSTQAQSPAPADAPEQTGTDQALPDLSQFKTADDLWAHIQEVSKGPATPPSDPQEIVALVHQVIAAVTEFQSRYPKDPRRWDAKLIGIQVDSVLASAENQEPDLKKLESDFKSVADAPDAPKDAKEQARLNLIEVHASMSGQQTLTPDAEKEMAAFVHDFPDDPNDGQMQSMRYDYLKTADPVKAAVLLTALLKDPNPDVVQMAQAEVRMRDLMKTPLKLTFTAIDGSTVDVGKLRGKVVLIDFWATWCGPCMEEVPDVVDAYSALHGKGFDIVGISLDQDKSAVESVTKDKGMVWPQYFDGKGWENKISSNYGITSIPCMWLVNKKGMIVDTDAREGLKEKIEKLLAE